MSPSALSPGSALQGAMQPDGVGDHSNGTLRNEASLTETDGAPVTPPTLGKLKATVSLDTQAAKAQSRSWFWYFLGYQASAAAAAETTTAVGATTAPDAAADLRQYTSAGADLPAPEKNAANNVRPSMCPPDVSPALQAGCLEQCGCVMRGSMHSKIAGHRFLTFRLYKHPRSSTGKRSWM